MKTYKIDPLGKNRPLMLVRGTRLPESFPDSVAEHMAKSLKANCRGVFTTINGEISSLTASPGVVVSREANEDNNTLVVMTEGESNESVDWEDSTGKQFRLEHAGRFAGSQLGGHDLYYTGPHKDLRTFVTGVAQYKGQPLVAANAKQWYSYTTPEGVSLTFRGCIQAPEKGGTNFVGLKIDRINFLSSNTSPSFDLTLDCDRAVSLGLRNGMNDESKPFNMTTGIGWLQIVATDDFISHLHEINVDAGNGNAEINHYATYDGFTYNVEIAALTTAGSRLGASSNASIRIHVKSDSALEGSIIASPDGYAYEDVGYDMSGSDNTFPMVEDIFPVLNVEPTVVNLTTDNRKQVVVIRLSGAQEGEKLHLDLGDTVTTDGVIYFRSMNTEKLGNEFISAGEKSFVFDIPSGDDVFAYFSVYYNAAGTLTISRTKEAVPEPVRTPGFYSADGQLVKAMTKEEVEQDYTYTNCPSNGNDAVKNATSFVWPEGVTKVGNYVFYECSGLAPIEIPSTVTSIGNSAFDSCSALTSVTIPSTVTSIGNGAFSKCSGLTSVSIPSTVTEIGNSAFSYCTGLTSVTIPEGVTSIGNSAFSGCTGLTSVSIPNTVTSIGNFAFKKCTGLNPLTVPNTVATIGNDAFKDVPKVIYGGTATGTPWGALQVVAPPPTPGFYNSNNQLIKAMTKEEVEHDYSYDNYPAKVNNAVKNATKFVWPEGVTRVGEYVFSECMSLVAITIPEGVTSIGVSAFDGCWNLTSVTIPEGVTSIEQMAFDKCSSLTSVTLPSTLISIEQFAFENCSGLTSVAIPDGITSIARYAFAKCTGLNSVTIPDSVTSIGDNAFQKCTGLNPLVVPNTVTSIDDDAFKDVPKVIYGGTATGSPWGAKEVVSPRDPGFYGADGNLIKAITKEEVETDYTYDTIPSKTNAELVNATELVLPPGVTKIGAYAFGKCTSLTSVTIPEGVTSIGEYAFGKCSGLTSLTIPDTVTSIGKSAFQECSKLTSVTIPEGVTSIADNAFSNCTGLTSVGIPSTVTSIGGTVFSHCGSLTSVTIPVGVRSIKSQTFSYCGKLASVTIPNTVTSIENYAFYNCSGLNPLRVPSTVTTIGSSAFKNVPKVIYSGSASGSPWGATKVAAS